MTSATQQLNALGQSIWLDYISRPLLDSGELARMVADGEITGLTSNPSIFEKAVAASADYRADIEEARAEGVTDPYEAFVRLAIDDIRRACDVLAGVWQDTAGVDGYVSLEIPPGIETDVNETVAEAKRLAKLVDRPNLMIKVPGTPEGVRALEALIFEGINVNQTLLFAVDVYEQSAQAYIRGLKRRHEEGLSVDKPASVASFFVSRLDTAVDAQLPGDSPLRGTAAVANAHEAYRRFESIFSGAEWETLTKLGARVQRPLWASTGTKNPAYSDVKYVDELVAPHTVNTLPEATLKAVLDHAEAVPTVEANMANAPARLAALAEAGIDLKAVTDRLLVDGLDAFERDFKKLLAGIAEALTTAPAGSAR
jgi:transaldolase